MDIQKEFLAPGTRFAVIGATTNEEKYGYRVLKDLHSGGYKVVGVNPHYSDIDGIAVYPTLADLPEKPDVAVFVVPPAVGLKVLDELKSAGVTKVWFQPGADSDAVRQRITELGLIGMADGSCIMVARRTLQPRN
ncbi:MAG: CoA-binding protein [bacterium]|nr:CoA-binding protein [bacterium]